MTVCFLTASYTTAWRIMFLDDFFAPFDRSIIVGSSDLITCTSIGVTVLRDIL